MSNVTPIDSASNQRKRPSTSQIEKASSYNSPVPQLIELLEPIFETIREQPSIDAQENLNEFLNVLELSRREVDQLKDIALFLLEINRINVREQ